VIGKNGGQLSVEVLDRDAASAQRGHNPCARLPVSDDRILAACCSPGTLLLGTCVGMDGSACKEGSSTQKLINMMHSAFCPDASFDWTNAVVTTLVNVDQAYAACTLVYIGVQGEHNDRSATVHTDA
jgi:hypothetical protein